MYYVVIDLEWNQYHNPLWTPTSRAGVKMHEEIIQIGAIKTDHAMNPVDTFKVYVRLAGGRRLDRYVKKLTHISDSDIASGEDFQMAAPEFIEWLKDVDAIFSWGPDDRRVFLNNLAFHSLQAPACAWYDAQRIYSAQMPEHGSLSLKNVAESMGIYQNLTLHDALNDAVLTAVCMGKLDMEAGVAAYHQTRKRAGGAENEPTAICTCKTHRHNSQQAAWDEACMGLLRCPECMQPLSWTGAETGTLEKWYKTAHCETHGDYLIRGEFNGQKSCTLRLTFFAATEDALAMAQKDTQPREKKRRRRRRKKPSEPAVAVALAPEDMLAKAIAFAAQAHKSQTRKGGSIPYIVHPMEAASIAATMTDDTALISAAVLHDTLEDCPDVTAETLEKEFGAHVAELVSFETEEKTPDAAVSWRARKQATLDRLKDADEEQMMVTLADKLSNARALARDYARLKDDVWQRFHQTDKRAQAWYYRSLMDALAPLSRFDAYDEFTRMVNAVFGKRRARAKKEEKET